jgi:hypothetical protein
MYICSLIIETLNSSWNKINQDQAQSIDWYHRSTFDFYIPVKYYILKCEFAYFKRRLCKTQMRQIPNFPNRHYLHTVKLSNLMRTRNSIRFDSIDFDSIRFDSIRFDSIDFDSIRFDWFRFDSIDFDSFRFGPH